MLFHPGQVAYEPLPEPRNLLPAEPVELSDRTMRIRKEKILDRMKKRGLDVLVVYGDREHGANFGYLAGYEPRFEESLIVLHADGAAAMVLGNEALRMAKHSRLPVEALHSPLLSLPNQPMENEKPLAELLAEAGISKGAKIGILGWKMFTSRLRQNDRLFDVPHFIVEALMGAVGSGGELTNACSLLIDPADGARAECDANEIAHFEFGATLASSCVLNLLNAVEIGRSELELASHLSAWGQPHTVQPICATGERFTNGAVAPRANRVRAGDRFTATMALRGGLTSRAGYVASAPSDLPEEVGDYLDAVVNPYYAAAATWYANMRIGATGGALYAAMESEVPPNRYGWKLNPGHLTSSEEWLSSPIFPGSGIAIRSGMMLQMDIILNVPGYGGANAEDGIAVADAALRADLRREYPAVWERITARRAYMTDVLGIPLPEEVLPLSNTEGYLRPLLLCKQKAMRLRLE